VPAHAYFRGAAERWELVGFERMPAGNPPTAARVARRGTPSIAPRADRTHAELPAR
jgi:hypothetical protein